MLDNLPDNFIAVVIMLHIDTLNVDYRNYKRPKDLPEGRLIEFDGIQMHVVGKGDKTLVVPRSFHAYSATPLEQLRDRVLADTLGAQVVGIDIPGVGLNHTVLDNTDYKAEAARGSQALRSEAMLGALTRSFETQEFDFLGYSLGAWAVAAMLSSPHFREQKLRAGRITLADPVNDQDWELNEVLSVIRGEWRHGKRYEKETEHHFPTLPAAILPEDPSVKMKSQPRLPTYQSQALGKGMRFGFTPLLAAAIKEDTHDGATGLSQAPLTIYRANGSYASRKDSIELTAAQLHASGQEQLKVIEFAPNQDSQPHGHLFWHSMGAVAMLAAHIRHKH